jgi:hypothetical protein
MDLVESQFTIADYCVGLERNEILVNAEYQRSNKVWPIAARSFLIETILLGYPIPKLFLHQITDIRSRRTYKEIVDGQQRSRAIKDFFDDQLRLSTRAEAGEIAGRVYSELDDDYKQKFLNYALSTDLFVAAQPVEIREVFRRMNSYTVPLNPEEKRHATFQGKFKWFIYQLSKQLDSTFLLTGIFKEKNLVRMADAKLLCEIVHAIVNGITTTNATKLDSLYRRFDTEFDREEELVDRLSWALDFLLDCEEIHNSPLLKPFSAYSLVLAISHISQRIDVFQAYYETREAQGFANRDQILQNLTFLSDVLEDPDAAPDEMKPFVDSSTSKTNVAKERITRFQMYCRALTERLAQ